METPDCGKLDYLKFAVTYRCNLNCRFCLQQFEKKVDLSWQSFQKVLAERQTGDPLRLVIFTGGEPLLWPHLNEAISLCKKNGVPEIGLFTNGMLLDDARVEEFKELGVSWFRVSIYGSNPEINDGFLQHSHSFDGIINALTCLKKHGFARKVRVTMMKPNIPDVEDIIIKMHKMGVEELDFRVFSPTSVPEIDNDYAVTVEELRKVVPLILRYEEAFRDSMKIKCLPGCYDFLFRKTFARDSQVSKCSCGRTYCGITAEGNIRVCFGVHDSIGNVSTDKLEEVWTKSPALKLARGFEVADECSGCIFLPHCKVSDCFAASYNKYGDTNHKNPLCPLERPLKTQQEWVEWRDGV